MADGFDEPVAPTDNPKPQVPGVMDFSAPKTQPGNTAASAPQIPAQNPPNVNGGAASFSDVTQGIADLVKAKTSELSASKDALIANTAVDNTAASQVTNLTNDTMTALGNIQKAERLPDGADGDLAQIFGLFNSDYNKNYQTTRIKMNEAKASQISATAAAIKEQNNALPAIMGKVSAAQEVILKAQTDANNLFLKGISVNQEVLKNKIELARLRIETNKDAREQAEFNVRRMTTAQLETALPQAQAGKGPLAGMGGLIEDRLVSEKQAITSLGIASNNLAKGNRDEYNQNLVDAVSHMPHDAVAGLISQAQAAHSPVVNIPTGQNGPDGKPQMLPVPFNLAQQGLVQSMTVDKQANEALAADYGERLQIIPNAQNILKAGNAFAGMDPRATQTVTNLGNIMKNWDPKDPAATRQVGLLLQDYKKQMDGIATDNAKKFGTREAQAAVENYGKNGTFDAAGGTAVMADSAGIPAFTRQSRYSSMWAGLNKQVASVIAQEHIVPGVNIGNLNNSADAMSILAQALQKPSGREKIATVTQNILADPAKVKPLADAMKGTIMATGVKGVISSLAQQKGADPIWGHMIANSDQFKNDKGQLDSAKLFEAMEKASIIAHANGNAAANYSDQFLTALRNYAATSDDNSASDPSYSVQDHAAEAAIFGGNPVGTVLGDLHYNLRQLAAKAHSEMQKRVQADVTGQTQRDAIANTNIAPEWADALLGPAGITADWAAKKIYGKTGKDVTQIPSSTGTGLTVAQIKAAFGGAH